MGGQRMWGAGGSREWGVQLGLLLAALVFLFPGVFLRGDVIAPGDLLYQAQPWSHYAPADWQSPQNRLMSDIVTFFLPQYSRVNAAFSEGNWPLWNPTQLAGVPLHANFQSAVFYPPRFLHYALGVRWGQTAYILLKLALCGLTAFWMARRLGLHTGAARFLSLAWMLSSYCQIWCNWPLPDVAAWLPVVFVGVEWSIRGRWRSGFYATALGGALLLLAGHPETAFAMGLGLGFYFVLRLAMERRWGRGLWGPVATQSAAWAVALLICAVILLPFAEYLLHSATFFDRPGDSRVSHYSFDAYVSLWAPRFFGTMAEDTWWGAGDSNVNGMLYAGWAVWLLAGGALGLAAADAKRRKTLLPLAGAVLFGLLLAGRAPGLNVLNMLPVFSSMLEAYHAAFSIFALPVLAALAADALLRRQHRRAIAIGAGLALVPPVLFLGALYSFYAPLLDSTGLLDYVGFQIATAAVAAVLSWAALAWTCRRPRLGVAMVTVILAADLFFANRGLNPSMPAAQVFPRTALSDYLRGLPNPTRIGAAEGNVASGILSLYGIEEWLGYDGLYPDRVIDFQTRLGPGVWRVMEPACAIAYYLHDPRFAPQFPLEEPGRFTLAADHDGIEVYRNNAALPRVRLVGHIEQAANTDALFARMKDPAFDPSTTALTTAPIGLQGSAPPLVGQARITHYDSTEVRIVASANREALLVLADAFYPGWKAWVDGETAEVLPVYHMFRGIVVPPGQTTVVFRYAPASFRWGLRLSMAGLVLTVLPALHRSFRGRRIGSV